nr:hypothetical protein [Tanacetum cinerariifolium]
MPSTIEKVSYALEKLNDAVISATSMSYSFGRTSIGILKQQAVEAAKGKANKGKKPMAQKELAKEANDESTEEDSYEEPIQLNPLIETSKLKLLKKFSFSTKKENHSSISVKKK